MNTTAHPDQPQPDVLLSPEPDHARPAPPAPAVPDQATAALPPHEYQQRLAITRPKVWRGIVALLLLIAGILAFSALGVALGTGVDLLTGRRDPTGPPPGITPAMLAGSFAGLAALTPWSMLLQKWFFKVPMPSLTSLAGAFRWDLTAKAAAIVIPLWAIYLGITSMAPVPSAAISQTDLMLIFILALTITPLQSMGEEYAFRGLVFRIAASWGRGRTVGLIIGIAVSSSLFMLAHGSTDLWLNLYYFVLGASLAVITWRTGGLELAVLLHAVNNTLAFLTAAILRMDMAAGFDRSSGAGGPAQLIGSAMFVLVAAVVWWRTRKGAARTLPAADARLAD